MAEAAVWYLVVQMALTAASPIQMTGGVTESQCEAIKASIAGLPNVVEVRCRRAVGMKLVSNGGPTGYAAPIFDGDLSAPVGSTR